VKGVIGAMIIVQLYHAQLIHAIQMNFGIVTHKANVQLLEVIGAMVTVKVLHVQLQQPQHYVMQMNTGTALMKQTVNHQKITGAVLLMEVIA
jgi:hypothetical protein